MSLSLEGLKLLGEFVAEPKRLNELGPDGVVLFIFACVDDDELLVGLGVTGLMGFDNTKDGSRLVSAVRGDNAGEGIDVGGIPYGCGCKP